MRSRQTSTELLLINRFYQIVDVIGFLGALVAGARFELTTFRL